AVRARGDRRIPIALRRRGYHALRREAVPRLKRGEDFQVPVAESLPRHPHSARCVRGCHRIQVGARKGRQPDLRRNGSAWGDRPCVHVEITVALRRIENPRSLLPTHCHGRSHDVLTSARDRERTGPRPAGYRVTYCEYLIATRRPRQKPEIAVCG